MDTPRIGLLLNALKESGRPVTAVLLPTIYTKPRTATCEPSVTINGSIDVNATKSPFTAPTTQQMIKEIMIENGRFVYEPSIFLSYQLSILYFLIMFNIRIPNSIPFCSSILAFSNILPTLITIYTK